MATQTATPREPADLERAQRRGRIVIVAVIGLFLAVCVALGLFLWQREQQEGRLDELSRSGLRAVAVPQWGPPIEDVQPLPGSRGLVITYLDTGDTAIPQLRALNLRAGPGGDACELLARAEPGLAQDCVTTGDRLTASGTEPEELLAEGQLHGQTLLVLVGPAADVTPAELSERVDSAETMRLRELVDRVG